MDSREESARLRRFSSSDSESVASSPSPARQLSCGSGSFAFSIKSLLQLHDDEGERHKRSTSPTQVSKNGTSAISLLIDVLSNGDFDVQPARQLQRDQVIWQAN